MVVILLVLAAVVFTLQQVTPTDPVHVMLGANASKAADRGREPQARLRQARCRSSTSHYVERPAPRQPPESLRTRRPVTHRPRRLPARHARAGAVRPGAGRGRSGPLLGLATAARCARVGRAARRDGGRRVGAARSCSLWSGSCSSTTGCTGSRRPGARRSATRPPARPGSSRSTGPAHGRFDVFSDALQHLVLPGLCVAILPAVSIGRVLRSSLVTTLRSDYVRTARAKGLERAGGAAAPRPAQLRRARPCRWAASRSA